MATFNASALGGSAEDGDGENSDNGNNAGSGSVPDEGGRGASYCCMSGVCGRKVVAHPILTHKNTTPPSASHPLWRGGPHTNKHPETFVLVDVWLLFYSKKVNFIADLRRKCVCRSDVALVETHSFGVPFRSFSVF